MALRSMDQDTCSSRSKRLPASGYWAACPSDRRLPEWQASIVGYVAWHVGEADHAPVGGLHRAVVCPGAHDVADGALLHAKISQV